MKVNFDGATKGNPGLASCGGVIRNFNGRIVFAMALPLGIQKNHYAKVTIAYHGLKMAQIKGYKKVWLEGDSLNIINNLKNCVTPSWTIESLIRDSIDILKSFEQYYISHILREGNSLVDIFANIGVREVREWGLNDPLPIEAIANLNHDFQIQFS